jgi:hypothetical protein
MRETKRAASRLNAQGVVIIAFFESKDANGDTFVHVLDGGKAPDSLGEVYKKMASAHAIMNEQRGNGDGSDVSVQ